MNKAKTILMLISGISLGALLGVLFAPGSGTATRRKLSNKGNDYLQNLGSSLDSIRADLLNKSVTVKNKLKNPLHLAKDNRHI